MKSSIVNESPLSPSSILMNTLNEIESSVLAESSSVDFACKVHKAAELITDSVSPVVF